jgi:hypothetical protein
MCPARGVYDFTELDRGLERAQAEGWQVVAGLDWAHEGDVPAWAENLEFSEFKQSLREFVQEYVRHLGGKVKYLNVAVEPTIHTTVGSRYVQVEYVSDYDLGVQPDELIELLRTAFDAAREVDSGILLGYSVDPDHGFNRLNPLSYGAWPCPYSFLKSALEAGVRPDYLGVEFYAALGNLPLDLSTVAASIQAYHDLSGLPVMLTEMGGYSSRGEDYGLTGPVPNFYWHEHMTRQSQSDWDTSIFKTAMGLPYVFGVMMVHSGPDYPGWNPGQPPTDCIGVSSCFGIGIDFLTKDWERKPVYYALQDLFDSWRGRGSAVTGADGEVGFDGLAGTYSIAVTTADGLFQTFENHLGPESVVVTVTLDSAEAFVDLQRLITGAQKAVDWSQQLGRQIDYVSLRSRLAEARGALAIGEYGGARAHAQTVLDATAITLDGDPDDWQGIPPIATAPPGGVLVDAPGVNLKALYGMTDDEYLYLMVEVYDPPISLQPGGIISGISYPLFSFDFKTDTNEQYGVGTYLPYTGQMDVGYSSSGEIFATLYTLAYGEVLEFKVPLALLNNPSRISVCGFVVAAEDGEQKGAKAFECYVDVLSPDYSVYLPVFAVR